MSTEAPQQYWQAFARGEFGFVRHVERQPDTDRVEVNGPTTVRGSGGARNLTAEEEAMFTPDSELTAMALHDTNAKGVHLATGDSTPTPIEDVQL